VAYRALRAGPAFKLANATAAKVRLGKREMAAVATNGVMGKAEVRAAVSNTIATLDGFVYDSKARDWVFIAETVLGADETLEAIADGFERSSTATRSNSISWGMHFKHHVAHTIGFLLLRASKTRVAEHVARLAKQHARFAAAAKKHHGWALCSRAFDVSLDGAAGVKRVMTGRKSTFFAEYAHDDPDYVRECVSDNEAAPMSVRLVAIAGLDVMKGLAKRRWYAAEVPSVMRDFGMVRAPETVELALSLVGKSAAKGAPIAWLTAHADYARPMVERAAKTGNAAAKAALSQMRE
jgi:hypothetical protein